MRCDGMAHTASNQELARRIEQLIREHIAASRRAAEEAVQRAFATARTTEPVRSRTPKRVGAEVRKRRASEDVTALGERFYKAVCAKPGEMMAVLAADVGATARELNRPMILLKRSGRVRSVGARQHTRYFPMAGEASTSG